MSGNPEGFLTPYYGTKGHSLPEDESIPAKRGHIVWGNGRRQTSITEPAETRPTFPSDGSGHSRTVYALSPREGVARKENISRASAFPSIR